MSESDDQRKIFLKIIKTIAVDMHASDTIEDIKAKVFSIEGVRGSQQELFFAGGHLGDVTRTLANYNIPNNSNINLYIGEGMQIFVKIPRKTLNLDVKCSDTIEGVKAKIADKEGISRERQELFYLGRSFMDHQTLSACNIRNNAIIHMVLRPMPVDQLQIFVDMTCGKRISLEARTWFIVNDVKMMIESVEGLFYHEQQLVYGGRNLEDHLTLSEYKITDKSILQLKILVQILVKTWTTGKTVTLMVDFSDTVRETMEKLGKKMGCNLTNHTLYFAGKILKEEATLGCYNIHGGDMIDLKLCF